jgi:WD40 repeat protein
MDSLSIIRDANRFVLYNTGVIENSPLQVYVSALVFSPTMSRIKTLFQDQQPRWISTSPLVEENWSPCLQTLEGHTGSVYSVALSPNSRWLASASRDETMRIWDAETGALQQTLKGHTS